jgi:hypothetical protein
MFYVSTQLIQQHFAYIALLYMSKDVLFSEVLNTSFFTITLFVDKLRLIKTPEQQNISNVAQ